MGKIENKQQIGGFEPKHINHYLKCDLSKHSNKGQK